MILNFWIYFRVVVGYSSYNFNVFKQNKKEHELASGKRFFQIYFDPNTSNI